MNGKSMTHDEQKKNEAKTDYMNYRGFYIVTPEAETVKNENAGKQEKKTGSFSDIRIWWPSSNRKSNQLLKKALENSCCRNAEIFNAGLPHDADEGSPDIGIVDLSMYNTEMIKVNRAVLGDLPIIAIGSSDDRKQAAAVLEAGASDYLVKPVSTEMLASVIEETLTLRQINRSMPDEKRVMGVMIPIMEYTVMRGNQTVKDAIEAIKTSFSARESSGRFLDTIHRSILVLDESGGVEGMVTIKNLVANILPDYLRNIDPDEDSGSDEGRTLSLSSLFWKGRFSTRLKILADMKMKDIMTPPPPVIDACATLLEAALKMASLETRRLVVVQKNEVIGIIREQDLFFEMEKILRRTPSTPIRIKK
jgi:CBS domain-containing protein